MGKKLKEYFPLIQTRQEVLERIEEREDGSIANVEVQKIGYQFPGQRAACYSADLLLRQYKRVKDFTEANDQPFSYGSIQNVYTIVFFESSPSQFKEFPRDYMHYFEAKSDTGLELDLLQKYLFIPLDIFGKIMDNKPILTEVEAWLTFLSTDEPERIISLFTEYPEFKPLYEDVYRLCRNTEEVMHMFSEELAILDKNTVQYMIDEMQVELDRKDSELAESARQLQEKDEEIKRLRAELERRKN